MYRFLYPATDTAAFDLVIDATTLAAAFEEYRLLWYDDNWIGSVAVFERERLVARVVPRADPETGRNEPNLELWPGEVARGHSFACGD